MGFFSNLSVAIIEDYERLHQHFPHKERMQVIAKEYGVSIQEVESIIYSWIEKDYDYDLE